MAEIRSFWLPDSALCASPLRQAFCAIESSDMRFKNVFLALVLVLMSHSSIAAGNFDTLVNGCKAYSSIYLLKSRVPNEADLIGVGFCFGFISGIVEGVDFFNGNSDNPLTCLPEQDISNKEMVSVVVEYINNNPETVTKYRESGVAGVADLVRKAFYTKYPCASSTEQGN